MGTRLSLGDGKKCRLSFLCIPVPVGSLEDLAILLANIGDGACVGGDAKPSFGFGCHPARVHSCVLERSGDTGFGDIAGTKRMWEVLRFGFGPWKTELVHQAHLPASMPVSGDEQWLDLADLQQRWCARPHACGIEPVCFGQVSDRAIVLGHSAAAALDGEPCLLQTLDECPPRSIYSGCILEWGFGLILDAL